MQIGIDTTFLVQCELLEHPGHDVSRGLLQARLDAGDTFCLAPQVLSELVHIVTDSRRFEHPLEPGHALDRARSWWEAPEVGHTFPSAESVALFLQWMREHGLGRKRLLDTMLAATYYSNGVSVLVSSNARDYSVFGCFSILTP